MSRVMPDPISPDSSPVLMPFDRKTIDRIIKRVNVYPPSNDPNSGSYWNLGLLEEVLLYFKALRETAEEKKQDKIKDGREKNRARISDLEDTIKEIDDLIQPYKNKLEAYEKKLEEEERKLQIRALSL